jgi:hypothetical protein
MRSRASIMAILVWMTSAVIACAPARQQPAAQDDASRAGEVRRAEALEQLGRIEHYEIGAATYEQFRDAGWPSFTILHMDVRSGPVESADAVVVLGVAGGEATLLGGPESLVSAVLEQSDHRGVCVVRGWLDGQRHIAALPTVCPAVIRDELDGILPEFDNLTGGDAVWVLRFGEGRLRSKQRI